MRFFILLLIIIESISSKQLNSTARRMKISGPYVESYWESWRSWSDYPEDFAAFLADVPAAPIGSCKGVNLVNIAFGDYSDGISGHESTDEIIRDGIEAIHEKGGYVKIALGGALYSMSSHITSELEATKFAESLVRDVTEYDIDGVDLDVEDSGANADIQIAVIREIRRLAGPDFHISYTIPCLSEQFQPWRTTIQDGHQYLDAINIMAYDYYWDGYMFDFDLMQLTSLGVPPEKMILGLMPGHHDASNEYTSIEDAINATNHVLLRGIGGVMTWDINRDSSGRMGNSEGEDNLYQTGQGDGLYLDTISATLNRC